MALISVIQDLRQILVYYLGTERAPGVIFGYSYHHGTQFKGLGANLLILPAVKHSYSKHALRNKIQPQDEFIGPAGPL